jgi:hypothetical protein
VYNSFKAVADIIPLERLRFTFGLRPEIEDKLVQPKNADAAVVMEIEACWPIETVASFSQPLNILLMLDIRGADKNTTVLRLVHSTNVDPNETLTPVKALAGKVIDSNDEQFRNVLLRLVTVASPLDGKPTELRL